MEMGVWVKRQMPSSDRVGGRIQGTFNASSAYFESLQAKFTTYMNSSTKVSKKCGATKIST
jgi:hypothetical protein